MAIKIETVLTLVSLAVAGVSAFYAYQMSNLTSMHSLQGQVDTLTDRVAEFEQRPPARTDDEIQSVVNIAQNDLLGRVQAIEELTGNGGFAVIPAGLVAAFDLPDGCPPDGWQPLNEAQSRFIVGASTKDALDEGADSFRNGSDDEPLTGRPFRKPGGRERHQLSRDEMPIHKHGLRRSIPNRPDDNLIGPAGRTSNDRMADLQTLESGGNLPHDNMPPYIALHYCKKT